MPVRKNINRPIDILDSRHVMSLILYINEYGPSRRIDIYDNVSRNSNMPDKIGIMKEWGLIEEVPTVDGMLLGLTDSGMAVANMLLSIESVLKVGSGAKV